MSKFQSFDVISDSATCAPRLKLLRQELLARGLDGFIVPRADEHQGEYVPPRAERLAWLTAFTGSAGFAVVLADKAAIFVDGRYTLMVRGQTDTKLFEPRDLVSEGPGVWIEANAPKGAKLGYDPWLFTAQAIEGLAAHAAKIGATLVACPDSPLDKIWSDQPEAPTAKAVPHAFNLAGETAVSKRVRIGAGIKAKGADALVLTMPDSIAWLFNIRGNDVPHTPFALGFAILFADGSAEIFLDERKSSPELEAHLGTAVKRKAPAAFVASLDALKGKTVAVDPGTAAAAIFDRLNAAGATVKPLGDPCQLAKACKNPVEIEGMRKAHIRDGVAMATFLAWIAKEAPSGQLTEISAAEKLEEIRSRSEFLTDLSFDSISAASEHAAIPHYHPSHASCLPLKPGQIYLIDSGGQYPDGTTDITRTMIVGKPTAEMKDRFTRVLKGHIALATVKFPEGTFGLALDSFARRPLWEAGIDFNHGTGHGVGAYLSVHEGPQSISKKFIAQPLLPGMVISNEPGYYKAGEFGIRIENLVTVKECAPGTELKMMEFETITLAPIDLHLVEPALLTETEKSWLNAYHARVREVLESLVDSETRAWLIEATRAI